MSELTRRYVVRALATDAPFDPRDPDAAFVLKPWKDPAALRALRTYRDHCYPELARDLSGWIQVIAGGPVVRGDVGRRNEPYAAASGVAKRGVPSKRGATAHSSRPATRRHPRAPAKRKKRRR